MKVLIVAKTRQGSGACIGGITFEGRSVRLIAADAATNEHAGTEYQVGEVWEVDAVPAEHVIPPHVENVSVRSKRRLGLMTDPVPFIEQHMPPKTGGVDLLYEGLTQAAATGALYIASRTGIPPYSTLFWRPDQPLQRDEAGKRIRYRYPTPGGGRTLTFVGFQEPIEVIPAGALVRVSLAHWWRPGDDEAAELRCYVQISGWFLPVQETRRHATGQPIPSAAGPEPRDALPRAPALAAGGDTMEHPIHPPAGRPGGLTAARRLLKSGFGYDAFRPLQAEIIGNILDRHDTLAVMPTGSGKSLCYQLPALLLDGLTVVVSPLISLMKDQVDQLAELGMPAAFLNSTLDYDSYVDTARRIRAGEIKLVYTSPEMLQRPETLVMLDRSRVACLAIDEAHCISEWGHDFRPEYRQLLPIRQRYAGAVCAAFTATATERVQQDIKQMLGLRGEDVFVASYNRENLFLEVRPRRSGLEQVLAFLDAHRDQSGIIYCGTRRRVDELAAQLAAQGWSVLPYHAGLDDDTRRRHQEQFSRDKVPIIVATIAFGMGINKSNVRFVLHHDLPDSLERYYQEIGRAGRDGLRADCLLLFSRQDLVTRERLINEGAASEGPGRHARLQAMVRYAEATECRRVPLLTYFDEEPTEAACGFCDNCLAVTSSEAEQEDVTTAAQAFLACALHTGQMFGPAHLVDVLRGSRAADVLRWHHDRLPEYGAGRDRPAREWRRLAEQFIRQGLLQQDMEHGSLRLTPKGNAVLQGEKVFVAVEAPLPAAAGPETTYDSELFQRLRSLRRELADAADLPPYVIFSDRSLVEMATYFPQSGPTFLDIHGVGQRKLAQYGESFLAAIRAYCTEHGLRERPRPAATAAPIAVAIPHGSRAEEVGSLFAAGHTVEEIAAVYGVTRGTVIQHLGRCIWAGQRFAPERIRELSALSPEDQAHVLALFAEHGHERLKPVFEALGGTMSYDELHVMRMYYLCAGERQG